MLDGLCLVWVTAFTPFFVALAPSLNDQGVLVFGYPGTVLPLSLWALALASVATPIAAMVAVGPFRPSGWSWWRWSKQALAMAILLALAATLLTWGFLGYSGWR